MHLEVDVVFEATAVDATSGHKPACSRVSFLVERCQSNNVRRNFTMLQMSGQRVHWAWNGRESLIMTYWAFLSMHWTELNYRLKWNKLRSEVTAHKGGKKVNWRLQNYCTELTSTVQYVTQKRETQLAALTGHWNEYCTLCGTMSKTDRQNIAKV